MAKNELKNDRRAAKAQQKLSKKLAKSQVKLDQELLSSQAKIEKAQIATLKAQKKAAESQGLTAAKVRRYLGVARLLAPVLVPIVYRGARRCAVSSTRDAHSNSASPSTSSARTRATAPSSVPASPAPSSRVTEIESLHPKDAETQQFADGDPWSSHRPDHGGARRRADARGRAGSRRTHAISSELDGVEADLLARLGVR